MNSAEIVKWPIFFEEVEVNDLRVLELLQSLPVISSSFSSLLELKTYTLYGASLIAQLVKNPPAMQKTPVRFLGHEDPLEKG